ncbi:oxidoreductase [Phaeobacter italicus]|uniref:oxidoreductase n=1 Tax=Phaeobacter italicus TaxID=481446 RepID=UPI002432768B|nr:oxidoreductase [Phaeobacter italicus]MCI5101160.1 oxidoreductase [Phaeobacter italicus]
MQKHTRTAITAVAIAAALLPSALLADSVLKISNGDTTIELDRAQLDAMDQIAFETSTIWTDAISTFQGPSLQSLIALADIEDGAVTLSAINDYTITIPVEDITATAPIVATTIDGAAFSRRDKGPYWVVYPYDSGEEHQTEVTYSRSIWQLKSISREKDD